ncbi:lipid A biosynthesis lauroyl acyltransferase [Kineosporia sp. NBRC 101677]|uniref:phosphatidylinositol mannoside acyltransferase n=1 Tax=Kineosporia sp. NBRC 101677 TaxID=3032197 RepID=UPI0024A58A3A|nr:phosphatidylinositol mannoside acyltransferase [Kineosporia sp. NBRC 101677]GLY17362.1 lipid A biosynthesis lauroyl acyltransferase [Kineosporia sp. NBRC 101677]
MWERLIAGAYLYAWRVVRLLPERLAYTLFRLIADFVWWRNGAAVQRLATNLARAVPDAGPAELRRLTRRGMRSYMRYWCDAFLLPGWDGDRLARTCRVDDPELLARVFEGDRGVVAALAHQGNWDHAGAWAGVHLRQVTTVAERLKPEAVYQEFLNYRRSIGIEIFPLGEPGLAAQLVRKVHAGAFVPLLADRDLSGNGVPVTFLGEASRMAPGPAAIALAAKAPLMPVNTYYEQLPGGGHGLVLQLHEPVPVPATGTKAEKIAAMTQSCADALSEGLRQHPEDWHMMQVVFDADLDPDRDPNRRAP